MDRTVQEIVVLNSPELRTTLKTTLQTLTKKTIHANINQNKILNLNCLFYTPHK